MNRDLCGDALGDLNTRLLDPEYHRALNADISSTEPWRVVSNPMRIRLCANGYGP